MNTVYGQMEGHQPPPSQAGTLLSALPAVQAIAEELVDPFRQVEMLKVKLKAARASGNIYEVERLEAKLRAAERKVELQQSRDQYWEDLRTLTRIGGAAAVAVAGAAVVFLLARSFR
jgi:NADPH-dependent ferric siderophore reductase